MPWLGSPWCSGPEPAWLTHLTHPHGLRSWSRLSVLADLSVSWPGRDSNPTDRQSLPALPTWPRPPRPPARIHIPVLVTGLPVSSPGSSSPSVGGASYIHRSLLVATPQSCPLREGGVSFLGRASVSRLPLRHSRWSHRVAAGRSVHFAARAASSLAASAHRWLCRVLAGHTM